MTVNPQGCGGRVAFSGHGLVVCYDVPVNKIIDGHGLQPSLHLSVIRKLEAAGKVERLQNSVLLVKDPTALQFIIDALERVNARYLIVEGRIEGTWGDQP